MPYQEDPPFQTRVVKVPVGGRVCSCTRQKTGLRVAFFSVSARYLAWTLSYKAALAVVGALVTHRVLRGGILATLGLADLCVLAVELPCNMPIEHAVRFTFGAGSTWSLLCGLLCAIINDASSNLPLVVWVAGILPAMGGAFFLVRRRQDEAATTAGAVAPVPPG